MNVAHRDPGIDLYQFDPAGPSLKFSLRVDKVPSMTPEELAKQFPDLATSGEGDCGLLLQKASLVEIPAGESIIAPGTESVALFLICSGQVRVSLESADECSVLGDFGPGQWIGEMGMIEPARAVASVIAVEDCALLRLSHVDFMELRRDSPALTSTLLQMLCKNLTQRLDSTVRFIDREETAPDPSVVKGIQRNWMVEAARNLIGVAARSGA